MRRGSSRRRMLLPLSVSGLVIVGVAMALRSPCLGGGFHRVDDVLIASAAADVSFDPVAVFFFGRVGIALQDLLRCHDHSRSAEAALKTMLVPESFLHLVQLSVGCQAFD